MLRPTQRPTLGRTEIIEMNSIFYGLMGWRSSVKGLADWSGLLHRGYNYPLDGHIMRYHIGQCITVRGVFRGGGLRLGLPLWSLEVKKICTNIQCKNMLKFEQLHV